MALNTTVVKLRQCTEVDVPKWYI